MPTVPGRSPMPTKALVQTALRLALGPDAAPLPRLTPKRWQALLGIGSTNRYGQRTSARHAARLAHRRALKRKGR